MAPLVLTHSHVVCDSGPNKPCGTCGVTNQAGGLWLRKQTEQELLHPVERTFFPRYAPRGVRDPFWGSEAWVSLRRFGVSFKAGLGVILSFSFSVFFGGWLKQKEEIHHSLRPAANGGMSNGTD